MLGVWLLKDGLRDLAEIKNRSGPDFENSWARSGPEHSRTRETSVPCRAYTVNKLKACIRAKLQTVASVPDQSQVKARSEPNQCG